MFLGCIEKFNHFNDEFFFGRCCRFHRLESKVSSPNGTIDGGITTILENSNVQLGAKH